MRRVLVLTSVLALLAACDEPVEPRTPLLYLTTPTDSVAPDDTVMVVVAADAAAGTPITSSTLRFTSSDASIAVVDSLTGRVVVRGDGDVTITARDGRRLGTTTLRSFLRPLETGGVRFTQLAMGRVFGCGLDAAGAAYCWGTNNLGQLGNGVRGTGRTVFGVGRVLQRSSYTRISAGRGGGCGITAAGGVECWGDALMGLVPLATDRTAPQPVALPASLSRVVDVRIGVRSNVCVIDEVGAHACWGDNVYGAIGGAIVGPSGLPPSAPNPVPGAPSRLRTIATGEMHGCGIDPAAALWCWGASSSWGRDDPFGLHPAAVAVPAAPPFTQLVAGFEQTCGLDTSGKAWCAGWDDSANVHQPFRAIASPSPFVRLTGAFELACGLTATGEALCWDATTRYTPVFERSKAVPFSRRFRFTDVSAGPHQVCGITVEGPTVCRDNHNFHTNFQ